jgi:hypothetical protein
MKRPNATTRGGLAVLALAALFAVAPAPAQSAKTPPAEKDDKAGWKKLFDGKSLDGWKSSDFYKPGKVEVRDGAVVMAKGRMMTGITYTRGDFPKMDYEVTLEGKKLAGDDFFCTTTFPVGDSFCSLVVGGWGGHVVGISSINSSDASENQTNRQMDFETGKWYRVRIRVSRARIDAWIDKEKVVDLETDGLRLSTRVECAASRPFGIATWDTIGAVRDVRVRLLTEAEKKAARPKQ